MSVNLPYHKSESIFRFYEDEISLIVRRFPAVTTLDPKKRNRSSETFSARLRDAMKSYRDHNWTSEIINRERFMIAHKELSVGQKRGLVYVGRKDDIKFAMGEQEKPSNVVSLSDQQEPFDFGQTAIADDDFQFLCLLAEKRLLARPIKLIASPSLVAQFEQEYDILLTPHGNNQFTLT